MHKIQFRSSSKEIHWLEVSAVKLLEYQSSNIDMQNVHQFQQDISIFSYSVVFIKKINVLSLHHCFSGKITNFLKKQKQPPEVFGKKGVLKHCAIFTGKHLCWSLFGVFGDNSLKKRLKYRYFPVNITKFFKKTFLRNICERLHLKQLF